MSAKWGRRTHVRLLEALQHTLVERSAFTLCGLAIAGALATIVVPPPHPGHASAVLPALVPDTSTTLLVDRDPGAQVTLDLGNGYAQNVLVVDGTPVGDPYPVFDVEVAVDLGDGTALPMVQHPDGTRDPNGEPYVITPHPPASTPVQATRDAYAQAASQSLAPLTSPAAIQAYIREAALRDGVPVDWALRIARCESGFNPGAVGVMTRTGPARGVFQFMAGTFARTPQGQAGLRIFDARANIDAAMWLYVRDHGGSEWECK